MVIKLYEILFIIVGLLFIMSLVGCSRGGNGESINQAEKSTQSRESERVYESADANKTNDSEGESKPIDEIQFEREITYGSTDEVVVGVMGPFAVDEKNRVFIADRDQTNIHVFDPKGNYLTSLGRKGEGPGEFTAVSQRTGMTIHSNRLYVTDLTDMQFYFPHRVHVFMLEELTFFRTIDLLAGNREVFEELDGYYSKRLYPRDDGTFLVSYHRLPNEYQDEKSFIHYVVQDSSGMIVTGPVLKQKDKTNLVYEVTNTSFPYVAIHAFPFYGKSLLAVTDNDYLYAANNTEEFKIDGYTPYGEHVRSFRHDFENRPLDRDELLDHYEKTEYMARLGDRVALNMIREADNLPETWPALNDLLIDDENRLWLSTIVDDDEIYEWWVLETSGVVITKFEWPRNEPIEAVNNGYMYTRETDEETELQSIVRYRVEMKVE